MQANVIIRHHSAVHGLEAISMLVVWLPKYMSSTELEGSIKDSRGGAMASGYGRAARAIQDLLGLRASVNPNRCAYFV